MIKTILSSLMVSFLFLAPTSLHAEEGFNYSYMPKRIYQNQLFPVTIIDTTGSSNTVFTFDKSSTIQPLEKKPLVVRNGDDTFYTFYFKASQDDVMIPELFISSDGGEYSLEAQTIALKVLGESPKNFSHILAANMKIKNYQVSNYDTKNNMLSLSIEAYEANLEDISLDNIETGKEDLRRDGAKASIDFFIILPTKQKKLEFNYFNTTKKKFITLTTPVELQDASVAAQTNLNLKEDVFERLKRYTLIFFTLFFMLMFLWKRDIFYLIIGFLSLVMLMTFYTPHEKICIKQGAPLYILPTQTSTIGTKIKEKSETMVLGEYGDYKKVKYKKGVIGWIKNEDICNN